MELLTCKVKCIYPEFIDNYNEFTLLFVSQSSEIYPELYRIIISNYTSFVPL